jgi:hypothetical protein
MTDTKPKSIISCEKYQYKPGTILYEEDIHYNIKEYANDFINTKNANQNNINEILKNYKQNTTPRLYEEDIYPIS